MATPRNPQQFIALKNTIPDDEARAAFSLIQAKPLPPSKGIPTDVEELRRKVLKLEAMVEGVVNLRSEDFRRRWNPMIDRVELEVGDIRDSNPKSNYCQNGGFRQWNAGVTLPTGWTAANSPTISRVTRRTGAQGGNYACRIASGGSAGSISRTARVKGGAIYRLAGWVYLGDSDTTATITLTDNGGTPVAVSLTLDGARDGVAGWFSFPRYGFDGLSIETASDATQVTIKLEASANDTVDFSDIQLVQGPQADPDLWEPAPEDIESAPGLRLPQTVIKANAEQVTSSTTLQNDDELLFSINASEKWSAVFTIKAGQALMTTGIKVAVTSPATSTISVMANMVDTAGSSRTIFAVASGVPCDFTTAVFAGNDATLTITANVTNGATGGNVTLQWAQSTSSATPLVVAAGSSVVASKV